MKALFLSLILWTIVLPVAAANPWCEKAGLASLKFNDTEEICIKSELKANEVSALEHIAQIHEQVALLFKVEIKDLFSQPLTVNLTEYIFGPFVSSANARYLNIGVYPGDDFAFNTGVYLHELGHALAGNRNPKLPAVLEDLDHSVLFSETFADLLALTVHGNIITPSEAPNCLDRLRFISDFQNYNYPQEYFENLSEARLMKCCESMLKQNLENKFFNFCTEAKDYFSRDIRFSTPFDPMRVTKNLDDHQVGIPFLSFIQNFSKKSSLSLRELFNRIILSKNHSFETYHCELSKGGTVLRNDTVTAHTASNMIADLKETLTHEELSLFEALFKKHVIEKGLQFSERETPKHILDKYKELIHFDSSMTASCYK